MFVKILSIYKEFKCIAGKCSDSCCDGWKITIDEAAVKKYKDYEGGLKDRLNQSLVCDEKGSYFLLNGSRCPFLNKDNLCDIYINMGKDALSRTCAAFPRRIHKEGEELRAYLSLACPEAVRLMLDEKEGIRFEGYDDGRDFVSGDDGKERVIHQFGDILIRMINEKRIPWEKRLVMVILAADNIRQCDKQDFGQCIEFVDMLNTDKGIEEWAHMVSGAASKKNPMVKKELLSLIMGVYGSICLSRDHESLTIDILRDLEKGKYEECFSDVNTSPYLYQYENFITYYIFSHIAACRNGEDIFDMAVMMCAAYSVIKTLDCACISRYGRLTRDNQIEIIHYYAKIIEHSAKDYGMLLQCIMEGGYDRAAYMIVLVN